MKLQIKKQEILHYLAANNKGTDQTAWMHRLICAFVVRIWHKSGFLMMWLKCISLYQNW